MKKIVSGFLYGLAMVLQVVLLWLPSEFQDLYDTRLGFMRQILFMNESYPVSVSRWIFWILMVALVVCFIELTRQRRVKKVFPYLMELWIVLITGLTTFGILHIGSESPLYYYDLMCFSVIAFINLLLVFKIRKSIKRGF
ncbi:hypothetical protein [Companilactobacillus baiquanensis]|uniref:Integral membrane protein n=1 Tax=Companilactobacillus baiquanensis TaxID=2486005 RepID=A0ABW1UW58_9LACO|nr:hypothetical protein [Companilactobacillus baiquanensis]